MNDHDANVLPQQDVAGAHAPAPCSDGSKGLRRTMRPLIGRVSNWIESPLPSRCGHAAPTLVQKPFSPLLLTCQAWKSGTLGSLVVDIDAFAMRISFLV